MSMKKWENEYFNRNDSVSLTVSELIDVLKGFPDDMPVVGTYEGIYGDLINPVVDEVLPIAASSSGPPWMGLRSTLSVAVEFSVQIFRRAVFPPPHPEIYDTLWSVLKYCDWPEPTVIDAPSNGIE